MGNGANQKHGIDLADRLARWDGSKFVPLTPGSVPEEQVFVLSHGWAPGLLPAVEKADGDLRVWDDEAETGAGRRFDNWYPELGDAILARHPDAAVLCFSWVDESATDDTVMASFLSQRRTMRNGMRLAWVLQAVLAHPEKARVHMIGHSHGAKVVTVASVFMKRPPVHLTIMDSPDEAISTLGGAANDLPALLRVLAAAHPADRLLIDNYVSQLGRRYGNEPGLEHVVDVLLTGEQPDVGVPFPSPHSYAWAWYTATARKPDVFVGFAWSRAVRGATAPPGVLMRQPPDTHEGPFVLDVDLAKSPRTTLEFEPTSVRHGRPDLLATDEDRSTDTIAHWFLRRRGMAVVRFGVRWLEGPPDAVLTYEISGVTLLTVTREETEAIGGVVVLPTLHLPGGIHRLKVTLTSSEPAAVRFPPEYVVASMTLPALAEAQRYVRPIFVIGSTAAAAAVGGLLLRRLARRLSGENGE